MSYICPLCNGLVVPEQACPHCLQGLLECGNWTTTPDHTAPTYSILPLTRQTKSKTFAIM
ncbi:MAG: hypothetical protein ACE3K2_15090 [Paenibacillus sp.]|uniref:hypothetical protein n=1 Tax=Paenibacillus sp. TaxID=58172 RepID=UPI003B828B82